jgi:hypothetical protein
MRPGHRSIPLLLVLLVVPLALVLASCGGDDDATVEVAAGEVLLEPAGSEGRSAFTEEPYAGADAADATDEVETMLAAFEPVASAEDGDTADADKEAELRTATGGEPGLYGGSGDNVRCDRELLERYLDSNPDKALAWVRALQADDELRWIDSEGVERRRLSRPDIPEFLDSLTPLVLTRDTRVTNHGYEDGRAVPLQSVLQAGTAVLVDAWGVPRVRCACGNPLAAPEAIKGTVRYVGTRWKWFSASTTINVVQHVEIISIFIVRDPEDPDDAISQPAGAEPDEGEPAGPIEDFVPEVADDANTDGGEDGGEPSDVDEGAYADAELGAERVILETGNIGGVVNGGGPVTFTLDEPTMITFIQTYHWNDAQGSPPGKIILKTGGGELVGSWAPTTAEGQGGVPNAYWIVEPELILEPGSYLLTDTSPATWATNAEAGGQGMATVRGRPVTSS